MAAEFTNEELSALEDFLADDLVHGIIEDKIDDDTPEDEVVGYVEDYLEDIGQYMFASINFQSLDWSITDKFGGEMWHRLMDACPEEPEQYDATNGQYWYDDDEDSDSEEAEQHREEESEKARRFNDFWTELLDWGRIQELAEERVWPEWKNRLKEQAMGLAL